MGVGEGLEQNPGVLENLKNERDREGVRWGDREGGDVLTTLKSKKPGFR